MRPGKMSGQNEAGQINGHHNSHNCVSKTLAKKHEPSKYNTIKACDG